MRLFPNWVKTTLKEDQEFYRALLQALDAGPDAHQTKILVQVKFHHLDKNRDLTRGLFDQFMVALDDLRVPQPSVSLNQTDPEAGSWYVIPGAGKLHDGKSATERLAQRQKQRHRRWSDLVEASEHTVGEIDMLLAPEETPLGEMADAIADEMVELERRLEQKILEQARRIDELESILIERENETD